MNRRLLPFVLLALVGLVAYLPGASAGATNRARPFKAADLKIEINATDGDAGLQIFLDDEAWREIKIVDPRGRALVDVKTQGPLKDYGLTELFSESSEPPFGEFPLAQFKKLFPEGDYIFSGRLTDGTRLRSVVPLTHDLPAGPTITQPREGADLPPDEIRVVWRAVSAPAGSSIVGYQVLVVREDDAKTLSVDLPASARRLLVPEEFVQIPGEYKVEVLAIEASGNQTLTEVAFVVS